MSQQDELQQLHERVARLESLLDKAIAKAKLSATGRAILQLLGLK